MTAEQKSLLRRARIWCTKVRSARTRQDKRRAARHVVGLLKTLTAPKG